MDFIYSLPVRLSLVLSLSFLCLGCELPSKNKSTKVKKQNVQKKFSKNKKSSPAFTTSHPILTIDGQKFSFQDFRAWFPNSSFLQNSSFKKNAKKLLDGFVRHQVILAAAKKEGFLGDPAVVRAVEQTMIQVFLRKKLHAKLKNLKVSDDEIKDFYHDNSGEFVRPEMRRFSMIVFKCKTKSDCQKAKSDLNDARDLLKKKSFSVVARTKSQDFSSRFRGGDVGFVSLPRKSLLARPSRISKGLVKKVFSFPFSKKLVSFQYEQHFYLIKQTGSFPSRKIPFKTQRSRIKYLLQKKKRKSLRKQFFLSLRKDKKIIVLEKEFSKNLRQLVVFALHLFTLAVSKASFCSFPYL